MNKAIWMSILLIMSLAPPVHPRKGGGGFGRVGGGSSRGASAARSSIGRGSSGARTSGGGAWGGSVGHGSSHNTGWGNRGQNHNTGLGNQGKTHNTGFGQSHNTGWNPKHNAGNYGQAHSRSSLFGGHGRGHRFSKGSGIGSVVRSNGFKNAIVGAAAGYLTYQAGKHIIRSMTSPMSWGGRSYYWGQQYYQPRHGQNHMCRMPIDASNEQFGNVYMQDMTSRPREIVWGCGYGEYCCGYECCRGGATSGYSLPAGYAIGVAYMARRYLF